MNTSRREGGVPTLLAGAQGDDVPDGWSGHMASTQKLEHNPNYKSQLDSHGVNWRTVGENVGTHGDLAELHQASMDSASHRDNIMSGSFTHAAVGCAQDTNGSYWVTVDFWSV